jgi:F-type H+-transporting ATPase subunit beta
MGNISLPILLLLIAGAFVLLAGLIIGLRRILRRPSGIVDTGLKAVDLLVPLPIGGDVLVSGEPRAGARLLGTELAYRLANMPRNAFRVVIYLDSELAEIEAICKEMQEALPSVKTIFVTTQVTAQDIRDQRKLPSMLGRDAIFAISNEERFVQLFEQAIKSERETAEAAASLTTFTVTETNVANGFDATFFASRLLAKEGIYPAMDVRHSSSTASSDTSIKPKRRRVADAVRRALIEVMENFVPGAMGDATGSFQNDPSKRAGIQLLWFLTQTYFIAAPYTGGKPDYVPLDATVSDFEKILAGRCVNDAIGTIKYRNQLQPK